MKKKIRSFLLLTVLLSCLSGCGSPAASREPIDSETISVSESEKPISTESADMAEVVLNSTYTTRFGEINQVTTPTFSFDYPDRWTVTNEEVTSVSELVELKNESGVTVTYWNFGGMRDLTGPTRGINRINITRVTDADFSPSYVQDTDYSDLGAFVVAKVEIIGEYDLLGGGEYSVAEDGSVRYALLPEGQMGEQDEIIMTGLPSLSFWYAGHISLIAWTPNQNFTEQETEEVIAILASFRDGSVQ